MGAASNRNQSIWDVLINVQTRGGGKANQQAMLQEQSNLAKTLSNQGYNVNFFDPAESKKAISNAGKTGRKMRDAMAAPFASGFIQRGFGINAEIDDFVLKTNQMRGITTGLRHEVGKLRNTLLLIAFATTGVVSAFKDWFQASLKAEAALIGLKSVAINTGLSFDKLKETSIELENKGFLSLGGSASALKNLAASNLTMQETVNVLKALTDAAAFNRQGTLSMEEAIVGATQGIKNQNSIMVDNAGITKNVSIMYREYALSIGKTSGALSEQEKKQAIVNGILREAALFAGNAEKSLTTYQGKLTQFQTKLLQTKRDLGALIAPGVVEGLTTISEIFAEQGKQSLFQKAIEGISNSFSMLIKTVGFFAKELQSTFNMFNWVTAGGLSAAFESPIIKLGLMIVLLKKVGTYITGMADSLRAGAFATQFQQIEGSMLRAASLMKLNWVPPTFLQGALTQVQALKTGIMNIPTQMGNTLSKVGTKLSNWITRDDKIPIKKELPYANPHIDKLREQGVKETQAQAQVILAMKGKTAEELIQEQIGNRLNVIMARRVSLTKEQALENVRLNQLDESRLKIADALTEREINILSISRREKANKIIDQKLEIERGKLLDVRAVTRAPKYYQIDTKLMNEMQAEKLNIEKQIQGIKLQNATLDKNTEFNAKTIGAMKLKNEEQINMLKAKSLQIEEAIVTQRNLQKGLPPPLPPGASPERKALRKAITAPGITPAAIEAKELAIIQEINNLEAKRALHNSGIVVLKTQNLSLESNEVLIAESLKNNQLSYLSRLKLRNELEIESLALNTRLSEVQHKIKTGGMKPELLQEQDRLTNQIEINRRRLLNVENGIDFNIEHQNFLLEEQKILLSGNLTFDKEKLLTSKEILMSKQNELETELLMNNARLTGFNIMRQLKDKIGEGGKVERKAGTIFMTKDLPGQQKAIESGDVEIVKRNGKLMTAYLNEAARANMSLTGRFIYDWKMVGTSIRNSTIQAKLFFLSFRTGVTQSVASTGNFITVLSSLKTAFITTGAALMTLFSKVMIWLTIIQVIWDLVKDLFKDNTQLIKDQIKQIDVENDALTQLYKKQLDVSHGIESTSTAYHQAGQEFSNFSLLLSKQGNSIKKLLNNMDEINNKLKVLQTGITQYQKNISIGKIKPDEDWLSTQQKQIDDLKTEWNKYYTELTALQDEFNKGIETTIEKLDDFSTKGGGPFSSIIGKTKDYIDTLKLIANNMDIYSAITIKKDLAESIGIKDLNQMNAYNALKIVATDNYYRELRNIVNDKEKTIVEIRNRYYDIALENVSDSLEKQLKVTLDNLEKEKNTIHQEISKINSESAMIKLQISFQKINFALHKTEIERATNKTIADINTYWSKVGQAQFKAQRRVVEKYVNIEDARVLKEFIYDIEKNAPAKAVIDSVNKQVNLIHEKLKEINPIIIETLRTGTPTIGDQQGQMIKDRIKEIIGLQDVIINTTIPDFGYDYADVEQGFKSFVNMYLLDLSTLVQGIKDLSSQGAGLSAISEGINTLLEQSDKLLGLNQEHIDALTTLMSKLDESSMGKLQKIISDFGDFTSILIKQKATIQKINNLDLKMDPTTLEFWNNYNDMLAEVNIESHNYEKVTKELVDAMRNQGVQNDLIVKGMVELNRLRKDATTIKFRDYLINEYSGFLESIQKARYEINLTTKALKNVKDQDSLDFFIEFSKAIDSLKSNLKKFNTSFNIKDLFKLPKNLEIPAELTIKTDIKSDINTKKLLVSYETAKKELTKLKLPTPKLNSLSKKDLDKKIKNLSPEIGIWLKNQVNTTRDSINNYNAKIEDLLTNLKDFEVKPQIKIDTKLDIEPIIIDKNKILKIPEIIDLSVPIKVNADLEPIQPTLLKLTDFVTYNKKSSIDIDFSDSIYNVKLPKIPKMGLKLDNKYFQVEVPVINIPLDNKINFTGKKVIDMSSIIQINNKKLEIQATDYIDIINIDDIVNKEKLFGEMDNFIDSLFNRFDTDILKAQSEIDLKDTFNFEALFLGIDQDVINKINQKYDNLLITGKAKFEEYKSIMQNEIDALNTKLKLTPELFTSKDRENLFIFINALEKAKMGLSKFEAKLKTLKDKELLLTFKAAAEELTKGLIDIASNLGSVINNVQNANDQIRSEQAKTIQDIDKLYQTGEISQGERLYRMAEMNKYYSNQIQSTWDAVSKSVIQSTLQMVQSIIQAMAQAAVVKEMGEGFLGIGSSLLAALPYVGAAVSIGLLAAQLADTSEAPAAPEFNTPENVASKFGGTIKAEEVTITIQPTFFIEGQQIFIGSGSVVEFVDEATDLMKAGIQQAIDNKEFTFDSIRSISK